TVVTKTADTNDGSCDTADCSLREAIANASDGDTITFDASLAGQTITLGSVLPTITIANLTIDASSLANPVTIAGNNNFRIFTHTRNGTFEINNLVVTRGDPGFSNNGGGIYSEGTVTVTNSTISDNTSGEGGGGIFGEGNVTVTNSIISENETIFDGGGIYSEGIVTVTNSIISDNTAGTDGGGIYSEGIVTVTDSTISGNRGLSSGGGIYSRSGALTLSGCVTVENNLASRGEQWSVGGTVNGGTLATTQDVDYLGPNCPQSITFDPLANRTLGDADFNISATADSGLAVTFTSATTGVCTVSGTNGETITIVAAGTCTINADQAGDATYAVAPQVQQSFTVNAPATTIVNKTADTNDGSCDTADCSLREAIANAADGDTITFDASLSGQTITLSLGELLTGLDNLTIDASALANPITIDVNNAFRIFHHTGSGTFEINNLVVTGGDANADDGGGIRGVSDVTVINSTISGNTANSGGGGISSFGDLTVIGSTISGNTTSRDGGGIYSNRTVTVINSIISGNTVNNGNGGGILSTRDVTVTNSTIAGNEAADDGGGIYSNRAVTLTNSLVLGNDASTDPQIFASNGITLNTSAYGFVAGQSTGDSFVGFVLADVFTAPESAASAPTTSGDYTLVACSPAINTGNNASAPAGNDLAGNTRIQNVTVDMGAFESNLLACQTIAFDLSTLPTKTYGNADFDISAFASASSGLAVAFTSDTPAVCTVTGSTVSIVAAGTCTINADQAGDAEYDAAVQVQQDITIAQKALDATVNNQNRDYGVANPALTLTYTGFVLGDTAADIDVAPTLATTAIATSNVGTYPITCDTAPFTDNNYTLNICTAGTLTVNQADVTVTADDIVTTEGGTPTFTATYAGFVAPDDETVLTTAVSFADNAPDYNTAGIYTITPSGAAAANYTFTYTTGTLTIQTAGFSITESGGDTAVTEGGATDTIDVVLTSIPTADVDITVTPDTQLDIGTGAGTASTLTFTPANWDTPQTINVTANDDTDVEGAHTGTLSFTVASGDGNYDAAVLADITVAITDDEPAVIITPTTLATAEGGAAVTYDVSFNTNPAAAVTVTLTPDAQTDLGGGAGTAIDLIFNDTTPQTVNVLAVDDANVEGNHTSTITHAITIGDGGDYPDTFVIADVTVNITDNDVASLGSGGDIQIRNGATTDADSITSGTTINIGSFKRGEGVTVDFLIRNPSSTVLQLGELSLPSFLSNAGEALPASLPSFGSSLLTLTVDTNTAGALEGTFSLTSSDPDAFENPFVFTIKGSISETPANALNILPGIDLGDVNTATGQDDVVLLSFQLIVPEGSVPVTVDSLTLAASNLGIQRASNLRLYIDGGTRGQLDNRDVFLSTADTQTLSFDFNPRIFQPNLPMWFIVVGDF
ncbi:MAG: MBG domain-containing protein, partial [Deinococcota bacterium]